MQNTQIKNQSQLYSVVDENNNALSFGSIDQDQPRLASKKPFDSKLAQKKVLAGLLKALAIANNCLPVRREEKLALIQKGACNQDIIKSPGAEEHSINQAEDLLIFVGALTKLKRKYDMAWENKEKFLFYVPEGWTAYAGEVEYGQLICHYRNKDKKEGKMTDQINEIMGTPYGLRESFVLEGMKQIPYVKIINGKECVEPCDTNTKSPLFKNDYISFVLDKATGQLLTWQVGEYTEDTPGGPRTVLLTSEDTIDEYICNSEG